MHCTTSYTSRPLSLEVHSVVMVSFVMSVHVWLWLVKRNIIYCPGFILDLDFADRIFFCLRLFLSSQGPLYRQLLLHRAKI